MSDGSDANETASADTLAWIGQALQSSRDDYEALAALPLVHFPRSTRLPKPPAGWHDLSYAVTFDGQLAILRANANVQARWKARRAGGGNREGFALHDVTARFVLFDGEKEQAGPSLTLPCPFPYFDRLADGSWIIADHVALKDDQPNALHIGADGTIRSSLKLGHFIEQLQADPDGGFWIGYGDAGVFSSVHGVEEGGIVRFDNAGQPVWNINGPRTRPCHAWCDHSYALNISAAGRWCYTYSEFLLTHLDAPGGPHSLRPGITGADAIAISGDRIMMAGMYEGPGRGHGYTRLALLGPPGRWTPRRPQREWIATVHRAINPARRLWTARGDTLHCVRGKTWHRLSIAEADALVPRGPWRSVPEVSG